MDDENSPKYFAELLRTKGKRILEEVYKEKAKREARQKRTNRPQERTPTDSKPKD